MPSSNEKRRLGFELAGDVWEGSRKGKGWAREVAERIIRFLGTMMV